MRREILLPGGTWPALRDHLLGQGSQEQLAFLLAATAQGRGWLRLLVREAIAVPPEALLQQTAARLEVQPAFSQAILRRCHETGLSLIEVHSHPFAHQHTTFSPRDVANEALKFRYVEKRIPHVRHATMVVGHESLDAHLWARGAAVPIDRVRALEAPITDLVPTSARGEEGDGLAPWLERQVRAFGPEGQRRLGSVRVGVVGCGGTGSAVVQMLAHLGVRHLVLVDPDVVEVSNLNRLLGATWRDTRAARPKVHVARRLARQIQPAARARALAVPLADGRAIEALKGTDLIFGCTDNHASRLVLNQLAVQYLIPLLDLGAGLAAAPGGSLEAAGGQVRLARPGAACLACIDGIDRAEAARELLSPQARQRQAARGYVQGMEVPAPAVLFLNNAVASLALAEFVNLWTGYRAPVPLLYLDLLQARLTAAQAERRGSCLACGQGGSLALGDLVPLPGLEEEPLLGMVPALCGEEEV